MHAAAPRHVSFLSFCASNVLIDLEPLYYLRTAQFPLHRGFHTYLGATAVAAATVVLFLGARALASRARMPDFLGWMSLTVPQLALGAGIGTISHVALDSLMHKDMRPFAPFSDANPMLDAVSMGTLHIGCVLAGLVGLCVVGMRRAKQAF